jgi:hypothetical protein
LCWPPPQFPELPAQEREGLVSSGAVSEFEQPARLSARSAPRGRRVRMASSPTLVRWNGFPASASVRPPPGGSCPWPSGLLSIGGRPEIRDGTEVVKSGTESPAPCTMSYNAQTAGLRRPARGSASGAPRGALGGDGQARPTPDASPRGRRGVGPRVEGEELEPLPGRPATVILFQVVDLSEAQRRGRVEAIPA